MSEPSDGDGSEKPPEAAAEPEQSDAKAKRARTGSDDVPSTRRQSAVAKDSEASEAKEPPARASQLDLRHGKMTYPDDGPLSAQVRKLDGWVGNFEQGALVFLMAILVLVTAAMAIADKAADYRPHWKDDMIRACTFGLAMIGGAFASHQAKHLAMDLISRRLAPRKRLFLSLFLSAFTAFIVVLLIRAGLQNAAQEAKMAAEPKLISNARLAWLIPLGGGLMLLHVVLHMIIDLDYIQRRKLPPERMRSH